MTLSSIAQKRIADLLEFIVTNEKIEIGKSVVAYLEKLLPEVKETLKLDFDKFEVRPGAHPRAMADVLLFKNGQVVRKLTVKTAVSANIRAAIKRMQQEKRYDEDGLLIFGLYCVRGGKKEKVLGLILIPRIVLYNEAREAIYAAIIDKVEEKKQKEKFDELSIVAMNESIILETASEVIQNRKLIEENQRAIKEIDQRIKQLSTNVNEQFKKINKLLDELKDLLKKH